MESKELSIAVLVKSEDEMNQIVGMNKANIKKDNYPVVAIFNGIGDQLQCLGLHKTSEIEFLRSAGYTFLSVVND